MLAELGMSQEQLQELKQKVEEKSKASQVGSTRSQVQKTTSEYTVARKASSAAQAQLDMVPKQVQNLLQLVQEVKEQEPFSQGRSLTVLDE